ncbi:TIGR03936 family radical SAM-associated protein [Anaerovoracaceae bacterium 42-11]
MRKYVIKFTKEGYIKYTSHLDMLRLFKRAFKKCGIAMAYSQGFNPHPKMGFAQPLSLGYTSRCELLEFETTADYAPQEIAEKLQAAMAEGVEILSCDYDRSNAKSLAAATEAAEYLVKFPLVCNRAKYEQVLAEYLAQEEIFAEKRQKKTKKMVTVDIRPKIRSVKLAEDENLTLSMVLDCGSASNLSPEQVIASFVKFAGLDVPRYEIEVVRKEIIFGIK